MTAISKTYDITTVVTAHNEGLLFGKTMNSLAVAVEHAQKNGLSVEMVFCLDNPDALTSRMVKENSNGSEVLEFDFKDQGIVRNEAIRIAKGTYIALLDGDDLWSFNWLTEAYSLAKQDKKFIVHPAFNWYFEGSNNILKIIDQDSELFDQDFLRVGNYWDALCFCHKEVYGMCPYGQRDIEKGFAYEDWHWNCETIVQGFKHKVAKNTVHFKRRRTISQTILASQREALIRNTKLLEYY